MSVSGERETRRFEVGDRVVTLVGWERCFGACTSRVWRDPGMEGEVTHVDDDGVVTVFLVGDGYVPFRPTDLEPVEEGGSR